MRNLYGYSAILSLAMSFFIAGFACSLLFGFQIGTDERPSGVSTDHAHSGTSETAPTVPGALLTFEKDVRPILKANCFQCHGEEPELSGGLDVRLVRLMREGGDSGAAIAAGEADHSLLWQRIESDEMPSGPKKLSRDEKQAIAAWLTAGAATARVEPTDPNEAKFTAEELGHWSFQPMADGAPPSLGEALVPRASELTALDHFIADRLATEGLSFSPRAARGLLLRRLTFDLHGLPPTPDEIADFERDDAADAYERVVDRLLASPQYGVHWARHWLDVVGYAESDGNITNDQPRPHAWYYRDYVVKSLNDDKPYDQFLVEQLAGDELIVGPPDRNNAEHVSLIAATGFLRMAPDITQTDNSLMDRNQAVADVINVVGSAVLGLSVGCAQCHDHRYDPITIDDYYRLRAVFDPAFPLHQWKQPRSRLLDLTDDLTREQSAAIEAEAVAMQEDINQRRREHCRGIQTREIEQAPEGLRPQLRIAVDTKPEEQTQEQKQLLDRFPKVRTIEWIIGQLIEYDMPTYRAFEAEEAKVAAVRKTKPLERLLMTVDESRESIPESRVFFRGNPESPTHAVEPGELTVLTSARSHVAIPALADETPRTTGRRLAYARQLTDGSHPLVARVMVNRVWMHHFGEGLVTTPGDFGLNGDLPSHPQLLDRLARDFVAGNWSLKRLHKQILMSRTYQQSAEPPRESAATLDTENKWLSRMSVRRLQAEAVRDAILAVSGQLNVTLDGPSVPVAEDGEGKAVIGNRLLRDGLFAGIEDVGEQANRRSVYIANRRKMPLNGLQTFDLPAMNPNCQQRDASTVAPQALFFLNDQFVVDASQRMADLLWQEAAESDGRIDAVFVRCFATSPTEEERLECVSFLNEQAEIFRNHPDEAWQKQLSEQPEAAERRALASLCQVLFASNRFLYIQ